MFLFSFYYMFIFKNPFRILFNSMGLKFQLNSKKFLLALKFKQSFILLIYFHITRFGKSWDVTHDPTHLIDLAIRVICQAMTHTSLWKMCAHANIAWYL